MAPSSAPRRIAQYELLEEIGRGAMGVVYRARQLRLDRIVALKLLLVGRFASPESATRFEREAQAAGRLYHPNIVATHDFGVCEGQAYLSMDWIPGVNLADALRDSPLSPVRAARCLQALARAVHYAHSQGILHRDLKPSNVLIDSEDQPHLTDFGLAKRLGESLDLTLTGQALGTPNYMAPEQAAGQHREIGAAADIYSLGAILYHCLTGRPPFAAATITSTLRQVQDSDPVPPRLLNPAVPRDLETLCLKCLEKGPARRFASAGHLADELGRFLAGQPIQSRPVALWEKAARWCQRHPGYAALGATVGVLAVGVGVLGLLTIGQTTRARRAEASEREQRQLVEQQAEEQRQRLVRSYLEAGRRSLASGDPAAALLWDVEALGLSADRPSEEEAHRIRIASILEQCPTLEQILPHPYPVQVATFTEDGRQVATLSGPEPHQDSRGASLEGQATVWDLLTGQPVFAPLPYMCLEHGSGGYKGIGFRYHPLGLHDRRIFTLTTVGDTISNLCTRVHIHETTTGTRIGVPMDHEGVVPFAEFSPDGHWIVVATARRLPDRTQAGDAQVWEVDSGRRLAMLPHDGPVTAARFSPDGQRVLTACRDGSARIWELPSGRPLVGPMNHRGPLMHASFNHAGHRLATAGNAPYEVRVWNAETGQPVTAPLPHRLDDGHLYAVEFSPDDRWLLSFGYDHTARLWDAESGRPAFPPLRHSTGVNRARISPDGRRITTATFDGEVRFWSIEEGWPVGAPLFQNGAVNDVAFAADDARFLTAGNDGLTLVWHPAPPGPAAPIVQHAGRIVVVQFSPDGRALATASADGTARVWDTATGRALTPPLIHAHRVAHVAWSPDSRRVATASLDWTARVWDAESGQPRTSPLQHSNAVLHVDFDPTGRRLVTASGSARWLPRTAWEESTFREGATFGEARLWDAKTGVGLAPPLRHAREVFQATFSPDGLTVLTACADRTARLWDAATGVPVLAPIHASGMVGTARFSPDGTRILTAVIEVEGSASAVAIWDAKTGLPTTPDLEYHGPISDAHFSPNGDRVVGCQLFTDDLLLWDARSGKLSDRPFSPPTHIPDAAFSPDGRWLATGGRDGITRIWDTLQGDLVAQFSAHSNLVSCVAFSPDGRRVASGSWDGTARIWTLPKESRPLHDLRSLAVVLAGRHLDSSGKLADCGAAARTNAWSILRNRYPAEFGPQKPGSTQSTPQDSPGDAVPARASHSKASFPKNPGNGSGVSP